MKTLVVIGATLIVCGCASSGVVPMDKGTFLITKRSGQVGTGAPVGDKAQVYREANAYCESKGMAVETLDFQMKNSELARPGNVTLQFKCAPK